MADANALPLGIKRFWTEYLPIADRRKRLVERAQKGEPGLALAGEGEHQRLLQDMVEYHALGMAQRCSTVDSVNRISRVLPYDPNSPNEAIKMAHLIWNSVKPAWEAWKGGQEAPLNGTPLAVWPGVTTEQGDILRQFGLRTVEEVAAMTDGIVTKIPLPSARDIKANAQRFLESADQNRTAERLEEKDREMAMLKEQLEEMRQIVLSQEAKKKEPEEPAKKRGRPRKQDKAA